MRYTICAILVAASVARVAAAELAVLATAAAQGPVQALDKAFQQPDRRGKSAIRHLAEHREAACRR